MKKRNSTKSEILTSENQNIGCGYKFFINFLNCLSFALSEKWKLPGMPLALILCERRILFETSTGNL